jgi:hypothetical protein
LHLTEPDQPIAAAGDRYDVAVALAVLVQCLAYGARIAPLISAAHLSRVFAMALSATGITMLYSSLG